LVRVPAYKFYKFATKSLPPAQPIQSLLLSGQSQVAILLSARRKSRIGDP